MIFEILTVGILIGGMATAVFLIKNKFQPEIEKNWENRKNIEIVQ